MCINHILFINSLALDFWWSTVWRNGPWVGSVIGGTPYSVGHRIGVLPPEVWRRAPSPKIQWWRFLIAPAIVPLCFWILKHLQSVRFHIYRQWAAVVLPPIKLQVPSGFQVLVLAVTGKEMWTRSQCASYCDSGGAQWWPLFSFLLQYLREH